MSDFKIEKGVPIPKVNRDGATKYPFKTMEIGDSFFFAGKRETLSSAASWHGRKTRGKFSIRIEGDGYRCWRVE